jgi:hypothetical protein
MTFMKVLELVSDKHISFLAVGETICEHNIIGCSFISNIKLS